VNHAMILTASGTLVYRFTAFCHYENFLAFGLVLFSWLVFRGNRLLNESRSSGYALLIGVMAMEPTPRTAWPVGMYSQAKAPTPPVRVRHRPPLADPT